MFDKKLTRHLAELSALALSDDEINEITQDMADIVLLMDKVRGFGGAPHSDKGEGYEDLREDASFPSAPRAEILSNSKDKKDGSFIVPRVV